jgi:hypothetical protein
MEGARHEKLSTSYELIHDSTQNALAHAFRPCMHMSSPASSTDSSCKIASGFDLELSWFNKIQKC